MNSCAAFHSGRTEHFMKPVTEFDHADGIGLTRFSSAIGIWINKPHVLHPKIFAAAYKQDGERCGRMVYPKRRCLVPPFWEDIIYNESPSYTFRSAHMTYILTLINNQIVISIVEVANQVLFTECWMQSTLLERLNAWLQKNIVTTGCSLSLVDPSLYQEVYERLKSNYSERFLQNWCEKTDPKKFVLEDLGIAAYLICLWRTETNVSFVDVGCGNGLLTYLLVTEGFDGIGVDVRRRRIWDTYPQSVTQKLKEISLDPTTESSGFPSATWLIGNHSDELTPWLPVLATRSSNTTKVFCLPCCPFGMFGKYNGLKHDRTELSAAAANPAVNQLDVVLHQPEPAVNHPAATLNESDTAVAVKTGALSQYRQFIEYLKELFAVCGFLPEVDKLRIPSTKLVCIVGRQILPSCSLASRQLAVERAVERERAAHQTGRFVPRSCREPVQNCTQLPMDIRQAVSLTIFNELLWLSPSEDYLRGLGVVHSGDGRLKTRDNRWWNPGGQLKLQEVVRLLSPEHLSVMKSQHGGLQTLLKNHPQAFHVTGGSLRLRWLPERMVRSASAEAVSANPPVARSCGAPNRKRCPDKRKTRPCWLLQHHPDGCPYPASLCDFGHGDEGPAGGGNDLT